jgi:magnesium transporter
VYLADAIGTQTETLAIRGLSSGVGIARIARHEARAPDCSSAAFSQPTMLPLISWLWRDPARRRRQHPD